MRTRQTTILFLALLAPASAVWAAAPAEIGDSGFITIMWGRSNWQATQANQGQCVVVPDTRTLKQNADDLLGFRDGKGQPLYAVGGVVVNRTAESGHPCYSGYTTQASWTDLKLLQQAPYHWEFVSQGMNYVNMNPQPDPEDPDWEDISDEELVHESLATLPILKSKRFGRAWGAFNYPNNKQDERAQLVVTQGFAFGRKYGQILNSKPQVSKFPHAMQTLSVTGGRCVARGLPCSSFAIKNDKVTVSVDHVANLLSPGPGQWGVVQFYRLVQGKRGTTGQGFAWDCTSPDWKKRWTSQPELYCRESFLEALRKRRGQAEIADPAKVAQRWGISVPR